MSLDYLEEISIAIDSGTPYYACPGQTANEWYLSKSLDELRIKAQRTANSRKFEAHIYRLLNRMDTGPNDCFLICRKILEPGPRGEPHMQMTIVDTRDAAELLRDVSQGPTPYFGATIEETFQPVG